MKSWKQIWLAVVFVVCWAGVSFGQTPGGLVKISSVGGNMVGHSGGVATSAAATVQVERPLEVTVLCRAEATICARMLAAFALANGYTATIANPAFNPALPVSGSNLQTIANPETRQAFMIRIAEQYILDVASSKEAEAAGQAARDAKKKELENVLKRPVVQDGGTVRP